MYAYNLALPFSIGHGSPAYELPWPYLAKAVLAVFCRQCGFTLAVRHSLFRCSVRAYIYLGLWPLHNT